MATAKKLVLVDADVLIHLYRANQLGLLKKLYPSRTVILDQVEQELIRNSIVKNDIKTLIAETGAQIFAFPTNDKQVVVEYATLSHSKGRGESACMAVCRFQKDILASSNLKDTKKYCEAHGIEYLTTLDLLAIAFLTNEISVADADLAIYDIKSKGSRLPHYNQIQDYIAKEFDKRKLNY